MKSVTPEEDPMGVATTLDLPTSTPPKPTCVEATIIGETFIINPETRTVDTAEPRQLCTITHGSGRSWTTNTNYVVYLWSKQYGLPEIVVRKAHSPDGSFMPSWWLLDGLDLYKSFPVVLSLLTEEQTYDILSSWIDSYHKGIQDATRRVAQQYREAFINGTLKKRKLPRQQTVKVWIEKPARVTSSSDT